MEKKQDWKTIRTIKDELINVNTSLKYYVAFELSEEIYYRLSKEEFEKAIEDEIRYGTQDMMTFMLAEYDKRNNNDVSRS